MRREVQAKPPPLMVEASSAQAVVSEEPTPREEHVAWCKDRALWYVDAGDYANGIASLISDLGKHPLTLGHPVIQLSGMLLMGGHLKTQQEVRDLITGCN